jgi:hypothetical protein
MRNIIDAIAEEKAYVADRMQGIETSLIARLEQHGYTSLDSYFIDKTDYLFSQIEFSVVEKPMPEGVGEIFNMLNTNKAGVLLVDWEDTYVVCANQGIEEFNRQYCDEHNITFFPLYTGGGTIVGSVGDFSFGVCVPKTVVNASNYILNKVRDILQKHTDKPVTVNGNDICVDGKKISGTANYTKDDVFMVILHFSFGDHSELISNICTTTKDSKPVAYVNFMVRDELKREVLAWLLKQ